MGTTTRRSAGVTGRRPRRTAVAAVLAGVVLLAAGCSSDEPSAAWKDGSQGGSAAGVAASAPAVPVASTVTVTSPAADATGVAATTVVKFASDDPDSTSVEVKDPAGKPVPGTLDRDDRTWTPAATLQWGTRYTITVTGPPADGKTGSVTSSFTTMKQPGKLVRVSSFLGDGQTVGVGMPLIVKFGRSVPAKYRAGVERRMAVSARPAQEGTWSWISPTEVHFRPKTYWKAYSKVRYAVKLRGVPMGDGWYGRSDLTVDLNIGRSLVMTVDNRSKKMTVVRDGRTVKTIPVSLGKPSTPSSSGTMVVMEKKRHTVFDTLEELGPEDGYRTEIDFAQRITYSGQYIHAAPWSEGKQGKVNVSHGCVNVSEKMGGWLFGQTMLGDPITVKGTESKLRNGNGWTDWNMSWDQFKRGSAL